VGTKTSRHDPRRQYRCRFCGRLLPAWLPVPKRPNSAMLLTHLHQWHPTELRPYLDRMRTQCIDRVVVEAYAVMDQN
jgi:hypothetical protein